MGFGAGTLALVAPKCPLCLAAWLSVFGVTLDVAGVVAPFVRPAGWVLVVTAAALVLQRRAKRRWI